MEIRLISSSDAVRLSEFYLKNSDHFRQWEPLRASEHNSIEAWQERLNSRLAEHMEGRSFYFITVDPGSDEIVGTCSLTNIIRGPFQACNMGYAISKQYQGKGIMKEFCSHVIFYAFDELGLNRIMANYMPSNIRSEALLNKLGFMREGIAKRYLKINGVWEDHVLTSLLNPVSA